MGNVSKQKSKTFTGKTAFICGGSKGIGKETAKEFFHQGGSVCILARDQQILDETGFEIEDLRINEDQYIHTIAGDASNMEDIQPKIEAYINDNGTPDYLINARFT